MLGEQSMISDYNTTRQDINRLPNNVSINEIEYFKMEGSSYSLSVNGLEYFDYPPQTSYNFIKNSKILQASIENSYQGEIVSIINYFINKNFINSVKNTGNEFVVELTSGRKIICDSVIDLESDGLSRR